MASPNRNIRIPDRLWVLAQQKAAREFTTVTAVIKKALYEYVREDYPEEADQAQHHEEET